MNVTLLGVRWLRVSNLHPHLWGNPTWDTLRLIGLVVAAAAFVRSWQIVHHARLTMPWRQVFRYGSLQLLLISIGYSFVATLGAPATYKTLIDLAGGLFALAGTFPFKERRPRP